MISLKKARKILLVALLSSTLAIAKNTNHEIFYWSLKNINEGLEISSLHDGVIDLYVDDFFNYTRYVADIVNFNCNGKIIEVVPLDHASCNLKAGEYLIIHVSSKHFSHGSSGGYTIKEFV